MRQFLLLFLWALISGPVLTYAQASAQPVVAHGLIIQLKPTASPDALSSRELPSVVHARREEQSRERMASVAQGAGVGMFSHRALAAGGEHRLMRFAGGPLKGRALEDTIRRLRLHPDVASVEPNVRLKPAQVPNDTEFANQWHLGANNVAAQYAALNISATWAVTTGTSVVVAVVDTGVRPGHPDLAGKLLPGYDFIEDVDNANDGGGRDADASDPGDWVTSAEAASAAFAGCSTASSSWHGTFIAGQIAAATNNGAGVAGVNWNARILPVRVSGKCGALLSDIFDGLRWAAGLTVDGVPANPNPARIINLSFGGDQPCTASYQAVIDEVTARGALVVVAAGNSQGFADNMQLKRPADCRNVMAVGAVQNDGLKTDYSYVGSNMALMAPGGYGSGTATTILSTDNAGTQGPGADIYGSKLGTSFSTPLAAGVASLMLAINPSLTPDALIARMKAGARAHTALVLGPPSCHVNSRVACNCTTALCGAGVLDALGAVQQSYKPAAVIANVGAPALGALIGLDGRASAAVAPANITSYAWSVVQGAGLIILSPSSSLASAQLPSTAGSFVIKLSVTDNLGRIGESQITVTTTAPSSTASSSGGGGGADNAVFALLLAALVCVSWLGGTRLRRRVAKAS